MAVSGHQIFAAVAYGSVAFLVYSMVLCEPWMIKTHQVIMHYGTVNAMPTTTTTTITSIFQPVAYPRWDSVKTYDVAFTAAAGDGKEIAVMLDACQPMFTLSCFENANRAPLLHTLYGSMTKSTHFFHAENVKTPEPRGNIIRGRDMGCPMCSMDLQVPSDRRAACKNMTDLKIRWELRVTPRWHWTDWVYRDLSEGLFLVVEGLVTLFGGPELSKW
jgi:hypothetical protein